MITITDKPLAAPGLTSYRYLSEYGYIMIGALDDTQALREADRSLEHAPRRGLLEKWDGTKYMLVYPYPSVGAPE